MKTSVKKEIVKAVVEIAEKNFPADASWFPMGSSFDAVLWGYNHSKLLKKLVAEAREKAVPKRKKKRRK